MDKSENKYISYVKTGLFYLLSFAILFYIVISVVVPDNVVNIIGFKPYVVLTQSMEPKINAADLVIVKNFDVEELNKNDIITFYADIDYNGTKEIVTHYIYSVDQRNDGEYVIRTNRHFEENQEIIPDTWVLDGEDVLGLYNFHIPWIGTVILFLQSPFGIAALIVNIGVIVAVVVMIKQGKKEKDEGEEKSE
ncbi:MAG: signal peptidase I [Candidatus Izemoplasmataceae bacterium]